MIPSARWWTVAAGAGAALLGAGLLAAGPPAVAVSAARPPETGAPAGEGDGAPSPGAGCRDFDRRALARLRRPPLGLPPVPISAGDRPNAAAIGLGRKLFLDRRLSRNGTLSCAMCHVPEQGFTVNETRTAVGFEGRTLRRNAPALFNAAYMGPFFHDGREPVLDLQPFDVFLNPDEMAAPSLGAVVETVRSMPEYPPLFTRAFRGPPTVERIGRALAWYLRTLLSARSPFDRWRYGGEEGALDAPARRGFALFTGRAGCARCHPAGETHALFTDHRFHDTGIGWRNTVARGSDRSPVSVELVPGVTVPLDRSTLDSVGEPPAPDLGRYEVTGDPADRWKFKTPSLRNVALTAPYMHDGSLSTLRDVVVFYNRGAIPHDGLDPLLRPLALTGAEVAGLVAFLESLTGENADALVRDARCEAIGNPGGGGGV
jgi:cytochrome c peroxidase